MSEKRKLIIDFALECFFIALLCLSTVVHSRFIFYFCFLLSIVYSSSKRFFQKKPKPKIRARELTAVEVIAWFTISFSALGIFAFIGIKGLLNSATFIILIFVLYLAIRSLYFSKDLAALQTSKAASN